MNSPNSPGETPTKIDLPSGENRETRKALEELTDSPYFTYLVRQALGVEVATAAKQYTRYAAAVIAVLGVLGVGTWWSVLDLRGNARGVLAEANSAMARVESAVSALQALQALATMNDGFQAKRDEFFTAQSNVLVGNLNNTRAAAEGAVATVRRADSLMTLTQSSANSMFMRLDSARLRAERAAGAVRDLEERLLTNIDLRIARQGELLTEVRDRTSTTYWFVPYHGDAFSGLALPTNGTPPSSADIVTVVFESYDAGTKKASFNISIGGGPANRVGLSGATGTPVALGNTGFQVALIYVHRTPLRFRGDSTDWAVLWVFRNHSDGPEPGS